MAYENEITITITAVDEASEALKTLQDQFEELQSRIEDSSGQITTSVDEATKGIDQSMETAGSAVTEFADKIESTGTAIKTSLDAQQVAWGQLSTDIQSLTGAINDSMTTVAANATNMGSAINKVVPQITGDFVTLGTSAGEYKDSIQTIIDQIGEWEGSLTVLDTTVNTSNERIIASNQEVILSYQEVQAAIDKTNTSAIGGGLSEAVTAGAGAAGVSGGLMSKLFSPEAMAGIAGVVLVKMAADFQSQVTRLYTTAGEQGNRGQIEAGIQAIADLTGESVTSLTSGTANQPGALYNASSAGYNQLSGLQIVQAAAEAAKAEGADPGSVANALTTAMVDYNANPSQATNFMNAILQSVSQGKTTLAAEATALPTVLTTSATAGLPIAQPLGALSTLTAGGVTSDQAAQDLSAMAKELSGSFTSPEVNALEQYGLNPTTVAQNFSKQGFSGTVNEIINAMMKSKTPEGLIMQSTFQQSQVQQADLKQMINALPGGQLKSLAEQLEGGGISYANFRTESSLLPNEADRYQASQIEGVYNKANSFNQLLTGGKPGSQTVLAALGTVFGQSNVAQGAEILYNHQGAAGKDVAGVQTASEQGGKNIAEWAAVQKNLNTQLSQTWQTVQTLGRTVGDKLIPMVSTAVGWFGDWLKGIDNVLTGSSNFDKFIRGTLAGAFDLLTGNMSGVHKELGQVASAIMDSPIGTGIKNVLKVIEAVPSALTIVFSGIWDNAKAGFDKFTSNVKQWGSDIVDTVSSAFTKLPDKVGSALKNVGGSFVHDLGKDLHIPGFAAGTTYAPGGLALLGEGGPELVELPAGSQVFNSPQTQQILNSSAERIQTGGGGIGGGGGNISITVNVGNYLGSAADQQKIATQIWQALQNIARQHGAASALPQIGILPA